MNKKIDRQDAKDIFIFFSACLRLWVNFRTFSGYSICPQT